MNERKRAERTPETESLARGGYEKAREVMGKDRVHGPEQLRKTFGIALGIEDAPEIPFSKKDMETARDHGGILVYRPTLEQSVQPLTIQRIMGLLKKEHHLFAFDPELQQTAKRLGFGFFTDETPTPGWALTRLDPISATQHLSYDAQRAFMERDDAALNAALDEMVVAWDEAHVPERLRPKLPTIDELRTLQRDIPRDAALPKAVDVIYDLLLHYAQTRERLLPDVSVATTSELPDQIEEPERPVDIGGFDQDGIHLHWRRSKAFGRPGPLAPGMASGIPIGYLQRQ